jgi:hypothetical protein
MTPAWANTYQLAIGLPADNGRVKCQLMSRLCDRPQKAVRKLRRKTPRATSSVGRRLVRGWCARMTHGTTHSKMH